MSRAESAIDKLRDEGWIEEAQHVEALVATLRGIYDDARYRFDTDETSFTTGRCRWCDAPPPDDEYDHDVACPAAKASYVLGLDEALG